MMGPPGGGKTTLARSLAARGPFAAVEPGNLLEKEIRQDTALGRQIKHYKLAGELVPPEFVRQVLSGELQNAKGKHILFDGFPRSIAQIDTLAELLKEHGLDLCAVLIIELDLQTALQRITGRRICSQCGTVYNIYSKPPKQPDVCDRCAGKLTQRADDGVEIVRNRLTTYERETVPAIDYLRKQSPQLIWEESAALSPERLLEQVWQRLEKAVSSQGEQSPVRRTLNS